MDLTGLHLCSRYSNPPNSLSLCGPFKNKDLSYYSATGLPDKGTKEILSQFSTLYPYLCLIASENHIADPFDTRVVEAYWLGNNLLHTIPIMQFVNHLSYSLQLKKKIKRTALENILGKIGRGGLSHHSFHVINIYKRTGRLDIPHTVQTMDACLINWGRVKTIHSNHIAVETHPLVTISEKITYGEIIIRKILYQGRNDLFSRDLNEGDYISYHWGRFCQKLNTRQLRNLIYYTRLSLKLIS